MPWQQRSYCDTVRKENAKQLAVQFIRLEKNPNIITSATYVLVDENGIIVLMGLVPQHIGQNGIQTG